MKFIFIYSHKSSCTKSSRFLSFVLNELNPDEQQLSHLTEKLVTLLTVNTSKKKRFISLFAYFLFIGNIHIFNPGPAGWHLVIMIILMHCSSVYLEPDSPSLSCRSITVTLCSHTNSYYFIVTHILPLLSTLTRWQL